VYKVFQGNNDARLSIEDPNNPDNDVSGGTREIHLIFKSFSRAFQSLKERMVSSALSGDTKASILQSIIAANYEEYTLQRSQLRAVFDTHPRFAQYRRAPTPPPPPPESPPPPPADVAPLPPNLPAKPPSAKSSKSKAPSAPASEDSKDKMTKAQRRQQASRERADRLRLLRPDIPAIPDSVSNELALSLGGYKSQSEMDRDLASRRREMRKRTRENSLQSVK
jgi:non-canonical poly(A) RNA polymerase PAPD5/7